MLNPSSDKDAGAYHRSWEGGRKECPLCDPGSESREGRELEKVVQR